MSKELIARLVGMIGLAVIGWAWGPSTAKFFQQEPEREIVFSFAFSSIGALAGLILTPYFTVHPIRRFRSRLGQIPAGQLMAGVIGLIVGLLIAALLAFPLSYLPPPFNQVLPSATAVLFAYFGVVIMNMRHHDIYTLMNELPALGVRDGGNGAQPDAERVVLLDTSVIIDGRIADITQTGFIQDTMLVPRVVLNELQHIADSSDMLRRNRGRRGLEVLNRLQKDTRHPLRITDMDVEEVREVDDKLVLLAKRLRCAIITNDYNLNRVAELQGVRVLNINELANAVKAVFLPGESMSVQIIQEGKEQGQGVGYLDDGTMVVVEEGRRYLDRRIDVMVTKVLQTAAGRMIFARPEDMRG